MATKRNKSKAKVIRLRTAVRKVVVRIRKLEEKADPSIPRDTYQYWYSVVKNLKIDQLELAVNYLDKITEADRWEYRVDLFNVASEALRDAYIEKSIGLES